MPDQEQRKNLLGPYIPQGNLLRDLVQQAKLAYNLMLDNRVNIITKLIPVAALAYLISPLDLAPDYLIPVLGQLDDVAILMLGLRFFFEFSPPEVVREHLQRMAKSAMDAWNMPSPPGGEPPADTPLAPPPNDPHVVDGEFKDE